MTRTVSQTRHLLGLIVGLCLTLPFAAPVRANEIQLDGHDLRIHVESSWIGGLGGGYYPLRIEAINSGGQRALEFAFQSVDPSVPGATRTVDLDAGATVRFTLLVPLARERASGQFLVRHHGEPLEQMARSITLPDAEPGDFRPAILLLSQPGTDPSRLEIALNLANVQWKAALGTAANSMLPGTTWASASANWATRPSNYLALNSSRLPESWLGYSTVDLVFVSRRELTDLPAPQRRALLDWAGTGGTLLVTSAGEGATDDATWNELLAQTAKTSWRPASRDEWMPVPHNIVLSPEAGEAHLAENTQPNWRQAPPPFAISRYGLGQLVQFVGEPFQPGSTADWLWLLNSLPMRELSWTQRHGGSARFQNPEFLKFLIPGQRSVPVGAMLILVSVFALAIGPLNYWLVWRRNRLSLLLLTIPGFAIGTTVFVLAYSLFAFGFSTQGRIRSLTMLDLQRQSAATIARVSLYAPFAPGYGPAFPADTAVLPVQGPGGPARYDSINWTERQQLGPAWLPSRTRVQFTTLTSRPERQRFEIAEPRAGQLPLSNGFEVGLKSIVASDAAGKLYIGRKVPAGGTADLKPADENEVRAFLREWRENPPELPDELDPEMVNAAFQGQRNMLWRGPRRRSRSNIPMVTAEPGLLEREWETTARGLESITAFGPRRFVALFEQNPGVETGVSHVQEHVSSHAVIGQY